jgi:hypothetical protein
MLLSRERFEQIKAGFHFQDDGEQGAGLRKVGIIVAQFLHTFQTKHIAGEQIALDEAMLGFQGTC